MQKKSSSLWKRISSSSNVKESELEKLNLKLIEIADENTQLEGLNKKQKQELEQDKIKIQELENSHKSLQNELEALKIQMKLMESKLQEKEKKQEVVLKERKVEKLKTMKENEKRRKKTLKLLKRNLSEIIPEKSSRQRTTTTRGESSHSQIKEDKKSQNIEITTNNDSSSSLNSFTSENEKRRRKTLKLLQRSISEIIEEKKKPKDKPEKKISNRNFGSSNRRKSTLQVKRINQSYLEIPKESKSDFKILPVFLNEKQRNFFQRHTTENGLSEQFKYYELYHKYFTEKDDELKESLSKQLFNDFIQPNGENSISFSQQDLKIMTKLYEKGSASSFKMGYRHVFNELESSFKEFEKINFESKIQKEEEAKKKEANFPTDFDSLIKSKIAYKLFKNYVRDAFGKHFIDCFDELNLISETDYNYDTTGGLKKVKIQKIIDRYCKLSSPCLVIHDPKIRDKILIKDKISPDWFNQLFKIVHHVLSEEYYPRFINSIIWKDYVNSTSSKQKNYKFDEIYSIEEIIKETSKISIFLVRNKATYEKFWAKRIIDSKENIENITLRFLGNQIKHENIIQLIESFNEEQSDGKYCLTIITTEVSDTLEKYIQNSSSKLVELEVVSYMIQILSALQHLHSQNVFFELGKLREVNIRISSYYNSIYLDTGFYLSYEDFSPYYVAAEGIKSSESDIYAAGFIFFRLLTFYSPEKIQEIYDKKYNRGSVKNVFQRKGADYVLNFKQELMSLKGTTQFTTSILNIVIQMIDKNPKNRPLISDIISELREIQKPLKTKFSLNWKLQNKFSTLSEYQKIVVQHETFRQFLKAFLRHEWAAEAILFYEDVQIFRNLKSDKERLLKAEEICSSYLSSTSALEINISGKYRQNISAELQESKKTGDINSKIFEEIAQHVTATVMLDSINRFEKDVICQDLNNYMRLPVKQKSKRSSIRNVIK
eukprot:gene6543-10549_t